MKKLLLTALFALGLYQLQAAEVAVFNYRLENPSARLTRTHAADYARMVGIAAKVEKNTGIFDFDNLERDLRSLGIEPDKTVTADQLGLFCRSRHVDYVIVGKLYALSTGYRAEAILFSAATGAVASRSRVDANTLEELAVADMRQLLRSMTSVAPTSRPAQTVMCDVAFVLDTSYSMNDDKTEIINGLSRFAANITERMPGSRFYLVPFNQASERQLSLAAPVTSASALRARLDALSFRGGNSAKALHNAYSAAVTNISWRWGLPSMIIVISNSAYSEGLYTERFATQAYSAGIRTWAITGGRLTPQDSIAYARLARMGGGESFDLTYHRVQFDQRGTKRHFYYERGRAFHGALDTRLWRDGLLAWNNSSKSGYATTPRFAEEAAIGQDARGAQAAYRAFTRLLPYPDLNENAAFETNATERLLKISEQFAAAARIKEQARPLARILLVSGRLSIWADISGRADLDYFKNRGRTPFLLGVRVVPADNATYGLGFHPAYYRTDIPRSMVPERMIAPLEKLLTSSAYYLEHGMFTPPLWFVEVSVGKIEMLETGHDIRDN